MQPFIHLSIIKFSNKTNIPNSSILHPLPWQRSFYGYLLINLGKANWKGRSPHHPSCPNPTTNWQFFLKSSHPIRTQEVIDNTYTPYSSTNELLFCFNEYGISKLTKSLYRAGPSLRRVRQLPKAPKSQNFRKEPGSSFKWIIKIIWHILLTKKKKKNLVLNKIIDQKSTR